MVSTQIVIEDDLMEYEVCRPNPFKMDAKINDEGNGKSSMFIHDDPRPSSGYFCLSATPKSSMAEPVTTEFLCLQILGMHNY